jgi:hypothetical protein
MQRMLEQVRRILEVELLLELGLAGFDALHAEPQLPGDLAGSGPLAASSAEAALPQIKRSEFR